MYQPSDFDDSRENDEWLTFDDSESSARGKEREKVEQTLSSCFDGENSLFEIFHQISTLACFDNLSEVRVDLVVSCGPQDFDEIKQNALKRAVAIDLEHVSRQMNRGLCVDPDMDLSLSFGDEKSTSESESYVTLSILSEDLESANIVLVLIREQICKEAGAQLSTWPSLVARIQEEVLGIDGSDWDQSNVPFSVSICGEMYVTKIRNEFLTFSSRDHPFLPRHKDVDHLLVIGGRDPHKNDFSKWAIGLPGISRACHSSMNNEDSQHSFTVISSCQNPYEFREFIFESQMKAINPRLKYIITTFLHDISEALSSIPCCALGGSDPDMIAQADFIAALLKIEFTGPSGEKFNFTPQQVAEIFNRGDVEKKRYISRKAFLNFWTAEARDSFVEEPSQHNQSNNIRRKAPDLQNLQGQIKASGTALKESQSLARHKIVHLRAQAKADLLRKRAMETTESCVKKIEKANLTMRIQQGIIENGTAKEPSIKKAQGIFLSAKKLLATAQSELERAKKQEAAAMVASAEASDAADAVDDASGAVDYFEEIRTYIQQLASPQGIAGASDSPVHKLFRELDVNQDGRLSSQELGRGIKDLLKELNIVVKRGGVELVCGWLDSDGSGFIEPEEFLDALSPSSFFQRGRNGISFEGLPCLARYHGHAQIFLEGSAGEVIPWQPKVAENQQARGHFFAATVGPMRPDGCFKAAFTRQRTSETSLYRAFSNFPISKNIIFQSCGKDDIYIHCKVGQERAVELFAERAAQSTRSQLIQLLVELISSTTMLRPSGPNEGTHSEEPNAVVRAIELGQLSRIIFDPDLGLLRIWKESTGSASKEGRDRKSTSEFQVATLSAILEEDSRLSQSLRTEWSAIVSGSHVQVPPPVIARDSSTRHIETRFKHLNASNADTTEIKAGADGSRAIHPKKSHASTEASSKPSVNGELFTSWNLCLMKMSRPIIIQAPELYGSTFQHSSDIVKLMEIFRFYFPDPNSQETLEVQLNQQFAVADKGRSGRLDRTSLADLIKRTVNGDKKIRQSKRSYSQETQTVERLTDRQLKMLLDLLDSNKTGYITEDVLRDFLIPRGSACPYDQLKVIQYYGNAADRIVFLIDPVFSTSNAFETQVIQALYKKFKDKIIFTFFVSVAHQESYSWSHIQSTILSSSSFFSALLQSEYVGEKLRENVFGVCISSKLKQTQVSSLKKVLQPGLKKVATKVFASEEAQAISAIHMTTEAVRLLSWSLGNALRKERTIESADEALKLKYATAANAIISLSHRCKDILEDLSHWISILNIRHPLHRLRTVLKTSKRQAFKVLRAFGMDTKSTSQVNMTRERERVLAAQASEALKQREYLKWNSHHYTKSWIDIIQTRSQLKPHTCKELARVLREFDVQDIGSLIGLNMDQFLQTIRNGGVEEGDVVKILHEMNKVRSSFWKMRTHTIQRSLWLLLREQYLRTEDLKLFYNVLDGNLKVPAYLMTAVQDGLELLTLGLDQDRSLHLVRVPTSLEVVNSEGNVYAINCFRHFFTDDTIEDSSAPPSRMGKISAETLAELLLAVRREIVHSVGWSPP